MDFIKEPFEMQPARNLPERIRKAGWRLEKDSSKDAVWSFISLLQRAAAEQLPLYVPVVSVQSTDINTIDPLDLQIFVAPDKDLFRQIELEQGGLAYAAYLNPPEIDCTPAAEYRQIPAGDFFRIALDDTNSAGAVLEPWDLSAFLTRDILGLVLNKDGSSAQTALYVCRGETPWQDADVLVNAARHPFSTEEPCPAALFKRAGTNLTSLTDQLEEPAENQILVTDARVGDSSSIFHVALPQSTTEENLRILIEEILAKAQRMGYSSVAMPAIGNEEAQVDTAAPFSLIAISAWFSRHPDCGLSVTVTVRDPQIYENFLDYLQA
ncbi:macro domain-containing protein [Allobaculum mucilyticum]|uniref:macro domain-containing protein n=1 Tax=Allobaculum mucilyticum TaxID=2834459 RepID=UPI001E581700|nr:macro domain-containing protein [Allobaculum mucilyticum]UNT95928.1 macro domain-containing protein [Allobaculum mucilyticum]